MRSIIPLAWNDPERGSERGGDPARANARLFQAAP
jgi:hypothetical protein